MNLTKDSKRRFYKGWAVPGPVPPGASNPERTRLNAGETLDALSGEYRIFQLESGHRYSTDDILTAWYGTSWCPAATHVLDLGSGIGSVGMVAAWRLQGAHFVTIEAQQISVDLARRSARYNGLDDRYEIRQGDFRTPAILKESEKFDLVLGSPPYFPAEAGIQSEHEQKAACRFELRGDIRDYCTIAAKHLNWGGIFACVFPMNPPHQLTRVESAARDAGLTIVRRRPVVLREDEPPLLCLFAMMCSEHLPEIMRTQSWIDPELVIRTRDGQVHPEYSTVKLAIGFPPL